MFRVRFHGRGGQGIKTAGQILGSAFFRAGFEVQDAPRYGAERRGAPITAYVRAARTPIHERGIIADPDLVVVADDTLMSLPAAGVIEGLVDCAVLLIATAEPAERWHARLDRNGPLFTLPAAGVGDAPAVIGAACAGGASALLGVIGREHLEQSVREEVAPLGAPALERSTAIALAAFDRLAPHAGVVREGASGTVAGHLRPDWVDLSLDAADRAAPTITALASSERVATGAWRNLRPEIDYAHCNRCSWVCGTLCPDSAIHIAADRTPTIDYDHCKGCLVCVEVCPRHAIAVVPERRSDTGVGR